MTFIYTAVFAVALTEAALLVLLVFPFGKTFQNKLCYLIFVFQEKFKVILCIIFGLICLMLIDSMNTATKSHHQQDLHVGVLFDPYSHCKMFYAQRNIYLNFVTLFMGFLLHRIPRMLTKN